jgi:predicted ester cyclase
MSWLPTVRSMELSASKRSDRRCRTHTHRVDPATGHALADGYLAYSTSGDPSVLAMFSPEFYDNVSKTRGLDIFGTVSRWLDESFVDRSADLHLVTHTDDTVVIWYTAYGRHIGNGFPRLKGLPINGNRIAWPQVHIFRLAEGLVVEHWAVRDDAAMLDAVRA